MTDRLDLIHPSTGNATIVNPQIPADNRILIMGVGRSGTTALYGLLQHILEDQYPGDVDYVYEPFLWDRTTFNKPYAQLSDEFRYVASISVEGMYHHKRLPLFATENSVVDQSSRVWLESTLSPRNGKHHYLGKMIRANGRIRLIRELAPNTKIIFIIRNPIDVLNSAKQLFSFFGTEFYESDYSRFAAEVEQCFQKKVELRDQTLSRIQAEYAYWYYSNRAFLKFSRDHPHNILTIAYEAFVEKREETVSRVCEFVDLDFQPEFLITSKKKAGSAKHNFSALSEAEYLYLRSKLEEYKDLLELVDWTPSSPVEKLIKIEAWNDHVSSGQGSLPLNALSASAEMRKTQQELQQVQNELSQIQSSRRYRFINRMLWAADKIRRRL